MGRKCNSAAKIVNFDKRNGLEDVWLALSFSLESRPISPPNPNSRIKNRFRNHHGLPKHALRFRHTFRKQHNAFSTIPPKSNSSKFNGSPFGPDISSLYEENCTTLWCTVHGLLPAEQQTLSQSTTAQITIFCISRKRKRIGVSGCP